MANVTLDTFLAGVAQLGSVHTGDGGFEQALGAALLDSCQASCGRDWRHAGSAGTIPQLWSTAMSRIAGGRSRGRNSDGFAKQCAPLDDWNAKHVKGDLGVK